MNGVLQFDTLILDGIHAHLTCHFLDRVMPWITALGDKGFLWIGITLVLLVWKRYRKTAFTLAVSLLICLVAGNLVLKPLVGRERPFEAGSVTELLIDAPEDFSFPSGHTMASFAAAGVLMASDKRLGIPALCIAVLIAFSRLYLYVHYPTDVLAGAALGLFVSFLSCRLCGLKPAKKG